MPNITLSKKLPGLYMEEYVNRDVFLELVTPEKATLVNYTIPRDDNPEIIEWNEYVFLQFSGVLGFMGEKSEIENLYKQAVSLCETRYDYVQQEMDQFEHMHIAYFELDKSNNGNNGSDNNNQYLLICGTHGGNIFDTLVLPSNVVGMDSMKAFAGLDDKQYMVDKLNWVGNEVLILEAIYSLKKVVK
jgi:hypothetical protein